jgi:ubiquinone/menaquinone biosynthesis C-methylase UbiE
METTTQAQPRRVPASADLWARVTELDDATLQRQVQRLEIRAAEPAHQAMRRDYLSRIIFPRDARVLEVGSGTGAVCRELAGWPGVGRVVGADPSPFLVERARELAAGLSNLRFEQADGRDLPFDASSFDLVVFHTTLCHIPGPEAALAEAHRVLRPGGKLAIFDGDYATATVALADNDPLQACVQATLANLVHDRWLVRRIRSLVAAAGFIDADMRSHGYVVTDDPRYFLATIQLGTDALTTAGTITAATAQALALEADARVRAGTFFGHIAYASVLARTRPPTAEPT